MVEPADLLQEARELVDQPGEVRRRTAVGRAYYAAYHHALRHPAVAAMAAAIEEKRAASVAARKAPPGGHTMLQRKLTDTRDKALGEAGELLARLWRLRVRADYELDGSLGAKEARKSIDWADRLFTRVLPAP